MKATKTVEWPKAFGIDEKTPYLLNMVYDPLAGCLIYLIKADADTSIGAHKDTPVCDGCSFF